MCVASPFVLPIASSRLYAVHDGHLEIHENEIEEIRRVA
jgi:hypothetical protein